MQGNCTGLDLQIKYAPCELLNKNKALYSDAVKSQYHTVCINFGCTLIL